MPARRKDEGFETLYRQLEGTVARLEEGGLTLEESLALYEQGMKLAQRCQELLQQAELRVTRLQETFAEGMSAVREEPEAYVAPEDAEMAEEELPVDGSGEPS